MHVLDTPRPGAACLAQLDALTRHFGGGCDCQARGEGPRTFRFKTMAAVKAELRHMGY